MKRNVIVKTVAGRNARSRILRLAMLAQDAHPWPDAQCKRVWKSMKSQRLDSGGWRLEGEKWEIYRGEGDFCVGGVENSRLMISQIIGFVNSLFSTSIL